MGVSNQQLALKPQDVVVLLKLVQAKCLFTYASLGQSLALAPSEIHASTKRLVMARLLHKGEARDWTVINASVIEFIVHGAKYAFPAMHGAVARGIPTGYGHPAFRKLMNLADDFPPVWPHKAGTIRGVTLYPLYPTVPRATEKDPQLYEALALFDAIRAGGVREREFAAAELARVIA